MPAPAPAGARAGDLASVRALERAAPATDAASVLADAAATLQMVPDADEAGFEETAAVTTARRAAAGRAAAPLRVHLRASNGRYLCLTGGVPRACALEACACEDVLLTNAPWGQAANTVLFLGGCGTRVLSVQPDGLVTIARDGGDTRHESFRLRLHSGGARPAVSLEAVSPDGASRPVRLGRDGALHAVARGPPSRFALEPASGSRVLLQLVASGELLCPVVAPPSARRVPVAFLAAPGAAAAWTLTHHGDGRYTLAAAADGEPRRHLTREPSGAVVLSSDPALAFPAPASLFTLEATSDGAGGVAAWLLRPCGARGAAGVVARGDAGRAAALQRSPMQADLVRIIDVAAAAAAAAGGGAAAHAAARAAMAPDAPRAACWATAGAAAAAADAGNAAGARRPPATLRALAAAALSCEAPMEAGGPPPAALSEAEQAAAFGAVYVPDYAAAAVKAAWLARQPAPGGACKVPLPPDASPFPGAMRCVCCDKTVLRMAAESNPAHHGYLAAEARRAARAAPPRNGSVPGAFWHAVGSFVCIALVAAAAGSGVRCAVHARSHRRAARAAAA